ncbi:sulfatase family protein [Fibrella aquatilis]|uniref:Sulfatase n=1 Tax=Fibrella aquatilis TaxID=2817059 RepID=A0A939GCZ6_9BACT|nr:sulfatase [Fibrella aquatilis]MBO0934113.1 sulfatase [Fibrella aquatilis]
MINSIKILIGLPVLLLIVIGYIPPQPATPPPAAHRKAVLPNIIFIFSDDHTHQAISAYGSKLARTPNIDRIANEGAMLHTNIVTNSICGPSRATLLTGQFSHVNGYKLNEKVFDVRQSVFPEELQKNGYQTAWIGKLHLGDLPKGFDYMNVLPGHGHYYNSLFVNSKKDTVQYPGYVTNVITKLSLDWLGQRDPAKPFFLVVGHKATHREWLPDLPDLGAYDKVTFPLPATFYDDYKGRLAAQDQDMTIDKTMRLKEDLKVHVDFNSDGPTAQPPIDSRKQGAYQRLTADQKKIFAAYYDRISREFDEKKLSGKALVEWKYQRYLKDYLSVANSLDRNIGELLNYLDKTGLAKNTVIVYASDQGFYLGEHGWFDKRFIYEESLKTPFVIRYPGVIKPHTHINQLISNIDWAPTLLSLTGTAIPGYIQGKSFLPLLTGAKTNWRKEAYYHYYEFPQPHHVYPHFGIRTEQYTLARFYGPKDFWELYDIKQDPHNLHNLYGAKGYETITADLKRRLTQEIDKYNDKEARALLASNP